MKSLKKSILLAFNLTLFVGLFFYNTTAHEVLQLEECILKVDNYGGAYLQFAEKMGGKVNKAQITAQKELGVAGCAAGSRIFQFTLNITKDGKRTSYTSKSHVLSREIKQALSSLSPGDEFQFKRIKAYLPKKEGIVDVHSNKFVVV